MANSRPIRPPSRTRKAAARKPRSPRAVRFVARNGSTLCLRSIAPEDAVALQRAFARLTPEQARMRTFHRLTELPLAVATFLSTIDPVRGAAFVVTNCENNEILADARIHIDPISATAEFGIAVDPAWTGQGIARALMKHLILETRRRKLEVLWGDMLSDNTAMLDLLRDFGFTVQPHEGDHSIVRASVSI